MTVFIICRGEPADAEVSLLMTADGEEFQRLRSTYDESLLHGN